MSDTAVTVQTLIDRSIIRARDLKKTNDRITDAQMLIYCNKAIKYVAELLIIQKSEISISTGTITIVASTQEYDLSGNLDDFWSIVNQGVYFSGNVPLIPITYEDKLREASTTTDTAPLYFYLTGTKIGLVNIPSATSAAAYPTLTCRYYSKPTYLALTDNMPWKNVLNGPISEFMDSVAALSAEKASAEITNLYNALEAATMQVISQRSHL